VSVNALCKTPAPYPKSVHCKESKIQDEEFVWLCKSLSGMPESSSPH
jgi:hypothetical protein